MENAKKTLKFYIKTLWEKAGMNWSSDNDAEFDGIFESISNEISEARKETRDRYKTKGDL
jgi:hypothetical protein